MPIFFQQQINDNSRLGIWKIEETETFFKANVPVHREVTHPHKRLQHLAGRFLLQYLFPDFPYALIQFAGTRKPFLTDEQYHFSISHCGDYAAAIVSKTNRVGIDIEIPVEKIKKIAEKFLSEKEKELFKTQFLHLGKSDHECLTTLWSCKEAVFKWFGEGGVDFKNHIQLMPNSDEQINCFFKKSNMNLIINYCWLNGLSLAWVMS